MLANIYLLLGEYKKAQDMYRKSLKSHGGQDKTFQILNNLAYASWKQSKKGESQKDEEFIVSWLKESILKQEQSFQA